MKKHKILIIGGGPSGVSAAVFMQRAGMDLLLFEREEIGGLITNANCIENVIAFPKGISGEKFAGLLRRQVKRWEIPVVNEEVIALDFSDGFFIARTKSALYCAEFVIQATGTEAKTVEIPGLSEVNPQRIFHEIRHLRNISGETIAILGAGDAAFDYALTLAEKNRVLLLNRSEKTKCLPLLQARVQKNSQIEYRINTPLLGISEKNGILHLHSSEKIESLSADRLVIAVGRTPRAIFFGQNLRENLSSLRENHRFFTIGDAVNGSFRQTAIAAGDGVRSAMTIISIIESEQYENYCTN